MLKFFSILVLLVTSNLPATSAKAENFTQFFKDFSNYCVGGIGAPLHYNEMAKVESWKPLPDNLKPLLRNSNGDDFDGWVYFRKNDIPYVIAYALGEHNGKPMHTCSLANMTSDYKVNVRQMKKFFKAERFDEYNMGMQYMEAFAIKLPLFRKAIIFTNQDRSKTEGSDIFKFDLVVYE